MSVNTLSAKPQPLLLNRHRDASSYKGVKVYHHDYRTLSEEDIVPAIEQTVAAMVERAEPDLLIVIDARGVKFSLNALGAFKRTSHLSKHLIKKIAVVGIHEIQTAFVNYISAVFKLNIRAFDDIDDAWAWLVK